MKQHKYYYFDERNDDFANNGIETKPVPEDFEYLPANPVYRFFKPVVYYFFLGFFSFILKVVLHVPFKNRRVLRNRKDKKKGYFIYGNHTSWITDAVTPCTTAFPQMCYTIANPDALSIKGAGTLIHMFGALPTPTSIKHYKELMTTVEKVYNKGCAISIFPEAHIWPKYNDIRNFPEVSFTMPVKLNAPCFVKTVVYIKKKNGTTRPKVVFDGPFYPNPDLPVIEAKKDLCERVKNCMKETVRKYNSTLDVNYEYIKVDTPEEMRSEITSL